MTLDIALELDHDQVRLLRRAGERRTELGALRLDDPSFASRLATLRHLVCGDDAKVEVKLPPSLVLFVDVGEAEQSEVEARVDEETPCALGELVIGRSGPLAAAVERITLEEASDFAKSHGFSPASFVADTGSGAGAPICFRFDPLAPKSFRSHRASAEPCAAERVVTPEEPREDASPEDTEALSPDVPFAEVDAAGRAAGERTGNDLGEASPPDHAAERDFTWRTKRAGRADAVDRGGLPLRDQPQDIHAPEAQPFQAGPARDAHANWGVDGRHPAAGDAVLGNNSEAAPTFLHAAFSPPRGPVDREATVGAAEREVDPRRGWSEGASAVSAPAPPFPASGRKHARTAVPSLRAPEVAPAKSEADAFTIFGARGVPEPKARSLTFLHAAAAVLAAGVLFAAYELFQDDMAEIDLVSLKEVATDTVDPLAEAAGDAAAGERPIELAAALSADALATSMPRSVERPRSGDAAVIEAPRSDLATPVALPQPIQLETPAPLAAPVLPAAPERAAPSGYTPPPPPGTVFEMDERGLVRPTEDGALTPLGVRVHEGPPATVPPAAASAPSGGAVLSDEEPERTQDDVALSPAEEAPAASAPDIPRVRPPARPDDAVVAPAVTALVAAEDTPRPVFRPEAVETEVVAAATSDLDSPARQAQTQAPAAGAEIASTAPRAADPPPPEPEGRANVAVQPSLPTRASVAERATVQNVLRLDRLNLIGVYGAASDRRALIRLPTGRYIKVKVGDQVDGGRVASIQNSRVEYVKGGRRYDLSLPSG